MHLAIIATLRSVGDGGSVEKKAIAYHLNITFLNLSAARPGNWSPAQHNCGSSQ